MKQKQKGNYTTTRTVYKAVKKYDHAQFDAFCTKVYAEGFKDGMEAVPGVDYEAVMAAVKTVKGIGEKRAGQIEAAVGQLFNQGKEQESG